MNTPAHVVLNLLCLGKQAQASILTPVVIGAILPDAPMFWFYFVEKVIRKTPESVIWRESYYQPHWQDFIDLFNSIPLIGIGLLVALGCGSTIGTLLCGSMLLHIAGDLPLHHDDAHRHFFPFSNWRFESPISYWDPNHYGHIFALFEILGVIISCILLFQTYDSWAGRLTLGLVGGSYSLFFAYALIVWNN